MINEGNTVQKAFGLKRVNRISFEMKSRTYYVFSEGGLVKCFIIIPVRVEKIEAKKIKIKVIPGKYPGNLVRIIDG